MIVFKQKGDFSNVTRYLEKLRELFNHGELNKYGEMGVQALQAATPVDTGLTASSWYYTIENNGGTARLSFYNSNENQGVNIAIILQYGHGTRNGGWVEGRDYINPAIQPIFDGILDDITKEVTGL